VQLAARTRRFIAARWRRAGGLQKLLPSTQQSRWSTPKGSIMKATVLIQAAAVAAFAFTAFAFTAFAANAAPQEIQKLPRVVITGKAAPQVAQLPRVVVTGYAVRDVAQVEQLPRVTITARRA
jgi:hypothetical protein